MYIPAAFNVEDLATMHAFIENYSFGTLVTTGSSPCVTHLPLLLDRARGPHGTLIGHVARPNPHWQSDHATQETIAIFHGPHAYISPSWYRSGAPAVPTWNYATVHAWRKLSILNHAADVRAIVDRTVETYEGGFASPWKNQLTEEMNNKLIGSIVAFEMPIDRLEGKFKLGQNRAMADQLGAVESLENAGDADSLALAAFTRRRLSARQGSARLS